MPSESSAEDLRIAVAAHGEHRPVVVLPRMSVCRFPVARSLAFSIPKGRPPATPTPDPTWGDRIHALRYVPKLIKLVWNTHPTYTLIMIVLRIAGAFVPIASLWIGKLIIDRVVALRGMHGSATPLWHLVAAEIAIVFGGDLLGRASSLVESLLGNLFSIHTSIRMMEHAATLDLAQFEDPTFYDQLERARRQTVGRIGLLSELLNMGQNLLTLATLGTALAVYSPWLLLLLAVAVLPSFLGEVHFAGLEYVLLYNYTPDRRRLDYLRYVGASDVTAKEVQMFGIAGWLVDRYRVLANYVYGDTRRLLIKRAALGSALSIFGTLGYYAAYVVILARTIGGSISIGSLTFLAASFGRSRDIVQRLLSNASDVSEQSLYLKDLFDFFEMRPRITTASGSRSIPSVITQGFVFEDVGFQYQGSERWAVRHISFALRPGERIALVGENGAGKTTLTKLLPRLYDATEGRILLEGVDIRDYDLAELRRAVGVIFQDFVRFDMRFDENIGVGEIERVRGYLDHLEGDEPAVPKELVDAAEQSLAASLLPRFEEGYHQMLGRRFEGGVALSGGEWQKIALARAYLREAQLLILDEPTAALDARAEYEVFLRFSELVAGRMAMLISHRFSTVRMADRIIVLQYGGIVEEGTHDELVACGGLYSELFTLQAAGYR